MHNWRSMSSNFWIFHTSGDILSRPAVFLLLIFFSNTSSSSSISCPSLMSSWQLIIFVIVLSVTLSRFWNVLSTSIVFLLGWQVLVLLSKCSSFCSLHLPSAMLIVTVHLLQNFWFYRLGLEFILVGFFFNSSW